MALLRRRKASEPEIPDHDKKQAEEQQNEKGKEKEKEKKKKSTRSKWSCIDNCCWLIGYIVIIWWLLMVLYNALPPSLPQYVTEAITGPLPDPPGLKLKKEGLKARHPVVFVPGIVTGGLELWEGHPCADGLFRKRLWGGTFGEVYKRGLGHVKFGINVGVNAYNFYCDALLALLRYQLSLRTESFCVYLSLSVTATGAQQETLTHYLWNISKRESGDSLNLGNTFALDRHMQPHFL